MADADADRMNDATLARDAKLLADTVREAGALALSLFGTELNKWTKGGSSPVSDADIAVNNLIQERLQSATPDYGWLSEESADDRSRLNLRRVWVVDPIDGTRNYLAGHDDWCVSVALVEEASPLLAAVFAPASDEFFFAVRGTTSVCNGAAIRAAPGGDIDLSRVAGPKPLVDRLGCVVGGHDGPSPNRIAGASAVPGRAGKARCGAGGGPKPRLGPCRGQFDRAGSEW